MSMPTFQYFTAICDKCQAEVEVDVSQEHCKGFEYGVFSVDKIVEAAQRAGWDVQNFNEVYCPGCQNNAAMRGFP